MLDSSPIPLGTKVFVASIKKEAILLQYLSKDKAKLAIGQMTLTVPVSDLSIAPASQTKTAQAEPRRLSANIPKLSKAEVKALATLDLHGLRVSEALAKLDQHLDRALVAGLDSFEIVHGIGSGAVKDAVHSYLKNQKNVRSFQTEQLNPGLTRVYL